MPYGVVSCIVPVWNASGYVGAALRSIAHQTYTSIEIVVVDDGSDDGSADAALAACPEARVLRQPHAGPGAARNRGVVSSRGTWLAFLDADDLWHREKLARQLAALEQLPHFGFSLTHVRNFWSPELPESMRRRDDPLVSRVWRGILCSTLLVRRKVFDRIGPFSESLVVGEDRDWFLRAERLGVRHLVLPDVLALRRIHRQNLGRRLSEVNRTAIVERAQRLIDARRAAERRREP